MKEILSARSKRQLELMELLVDNDWLTFATASEILDVPVKTIKSDIIELETLLSPTTIESSKKYGIRLVADFGFCKTSIYQKFIKNSIEFQLIEKIFLHNFSTIHDLADHLYISVSTIKRMVARINQFLQLEGFTIHLKKMQLIGDPRSICNFMEHYFQEKYGVAEKLLTPAQIAILDQVTNQILGKFLSKELLLNELDFSLLNQLRFYSFTTIGLLKNNNENRIHYRSEKEFSLLENPYICSEFYSQFNLTLSSTNMNSIFYLFFNDHYVDSLETLNQVTKTDQQLHLKYKKIETLIHGIEKKFQVPCTHFDDIILRLYNLDSQIHGRTYILYDKNKEFFLEIKNLYGHFPTEITQSLQAIFYLSPYKEFIVYEAISILFTQWPALLERLEQSTPTMKAALLFNAGTEYMDMLSGRISYYLNGRFSCTPLKITSLDALDNLADTFDCILTNIPEIHVKNIPVIVIPLIPDAKSFDQLMFVYEEHFGKN